MSVQIDFFDTDLDLANKEYQLVFNRVENVRKGIFKRHNDLAKMYIELQQEMQFLRHEMANLKRELKREHSPFQTGISLQTGTYSFAP